MKSRKQLKSQQWGCSAVLEECIPTFHHQFARLLCIFQQTTARGSQRVQYKVLLCIKVKSKCVTSGERSPQLKARSWQLRAGSWKMGAQVSDLGMLFSGLCLFRLRGSRQNKVKCFIYGRMPECCMLRVVSVGVASVICVVATRQTMRSVRRQSDGFCLLPDPP